MEQYKRTGYGSFGTKGHVPHIIMSDEEIKQHDQTLLEKWRKEDESFHLTKEEWEENGVTFSFDEDMKYFNDCFDKACKLNKIFVVEVETKFAMSCLMFDSIEEIEERDNCPMKRIIFPRICYKKQ
jgi:hypothetical protein